MVGSRILKGAGCVAIAGAIGVIVIYGGQEKEEVCGDESPIGYYGDKESHFPKENIEVAEDRNYTYYPKELEANETENIDSSQEILSNEMKNSPHIFVNPQTGVKNISDVEDTFCEKYAEKLSNYDIEDVRKNSIFYNMAYAEYYGLIDYANLNQKIRIPYIFDGGINCSHAKSQIYIKESVGENEDLIPTFDLEKKATSMEYFGIYASCNDGNMDVEFTFSLLKKDTDNKYTRYNFVFDVNIGGNTQGEYPSFFGAYFEDFAGFDTNNLKDCSVISISYKIKENGWHKSGNEEFAFLKLYEILLPESNWQ